MKMWILVAAGILFFLYFFYYRQHPLASRVRINGHTIRVDVAATMYEKAKGLGGRAALDPNHGMLFVYDHKEQFEFWMLGMKFPLDFIWIADRKVVDITKNVPPPKGLEKPVIVKPNAPANIILELTAGEVERLGLKIGDSVEFLDK